MRIMEIQPIDNKMSKEVEEYFEYHRLVREQYINSMGIPKELLQPAPKAKHFEKNRKTVMEYIGLLAARASTLISNACTRFREHCR